MTHFAATFLNLALPNKAGFEQIMEAVKKHLGDNWSTPTWPDIRRLHRTRNLVQHEGLEVDQANISVWAAATSSYTRSLVSAVWGVNISDAALAEAVRDADLKGLLRNAEVNARRNSPIESIEYSRQAFRTAYGYWQKQYRRRMAFHREPMRTDIVDRSAFDYLKREIAEVDEASVAIAFSGDPGEYVWFRDITANPEVVRTVTADEAQRALGFVFGWIVRWESFTDSYIPDLAHRRQVEQRRVRTTHGPAHVAAARVLREVDGTQVELDLIDVPDADDYDLWRSTLLRLLKEGRQVQEWWNVTDSGKLRHGSAEGAISATELAECVSAALLRVEVDIQARRSEDEASRRARISEAAAYGKSYEATVSRFPSWVEKVWLAETLETMGGFSQSRLMFSITESAWPYRQTIASSLRVDEKIEQCYPSGQEKALRVFPQLDVMELASAFEGISADIEEMIADGIASKRTMEDSRQFLESQLKEAFRL
ncbi:hypothetical protein RM574_20315 [Streptomyces sp. DSM 41982]|uniref:Apea-like HEPN domain-containing protein n=1 Tax=Streptomyces evansiae TaxID=3075535 RepID=A0ABD5E8U5_9ACTN|nr:MULTISPECIES: hypothetical protein [unclassified Streptomyces]MDT0417829.1 hypothetical protein [Streptomyces sp. DSM 41982]